MIGDLDDAPAILRGEAGTDDRAVVSAAHDPRRHLERPRPPRRAWRPWRGVVRAEAVDILLLQESGPRRRLRALGAALGMVVCADPSAFPRRRVQNAVLVATAVEQVRSHRLVRFDGGSLVHPRGVLIARLDDVTAVSVHLGLRGRGARHATSSSSSRSSAGLERAGRDRGRPERASRGRRAGRDRGESSGRVDARRATAGHGQVTAATFPSDEPDRADRLPLRGSGGPAAPRLDRRRHGLRPPDGGRRARGRRLAARTRRASRVPEELDRHEQPEEA